MVDHLRRTPQNVVEFHKTLHCLPIPTETQHHNGLLFGDEHIDGHSTVGSLNNGHIGTSHCVLFREVVLSLEVKMY